MKFLRLLCLLPTLVILLATCKEAGAPTDANGNPTGNVTTTLAGIVVDESGQPVPSAAIIANGKNTVTDKYGTFMIQNAVVPGNRCFIICKKNGYFTGSRAEVPKSGGITELRLTLQSSAPGYTVNSPTGGTLTIGTASVKFPPSAFVTSDGKPFTGTVKVAAKHLDPSQSSFYNSFSGDMTARRTDGTQTELLSYGVLRIRLTDDAGNELKLAAGKTATLTYPIAASQQKTAPTSMPLWYFDEALGMWKEEGVATKSGDSYSGEVSHFTDWNCDVPAKTGIVKGRVVCNNDGVAGIYVTVGQRRAVTDNNGYFSSGVAINTDFTISINPLNNNNLTASAVDVAALKSGEERTIDIQLTSCPAQISGTIVDCNDRPVAGMVMVTYSGGSTTHFTTSGEFRLRVPSNIDASVEATSYNGYLAPIQTVKSVNAGENKDIGRLATCAGENSEEFYELNLGEGYISGTTFSGDGSMIAICGITANNKGKGSFMSVYDTKTGIKLSEIKYDNNYFTQAVNFSDDGTKLLTNMADSSVCVVNPRTAETIQKFKKVKQARLLPDGSAVITQNYTSTSTSSEYSTSTGTKIKDFSFNELGGVWELVGVRGASQILMLHSDNVQKMIKIIEWDIASDQKNNEFVFPKSEYHTPGAEISPDCSIISLVDGSEKTINFYNSHTGAKINSVEQKITEYDRSYGIANDMTFVVQREQSNGSGRFLSPTTYSMTDGSLLKELAIPPSNTEYGWFTFSGNSQYVAGRKTYTIEAHTITYMVVRIWKVK